ncbi:MAG: WYL domain-containing protein [Gammaproteobacteria bacterium]|nr:WYL domain-containing protein [Gammaproteobacteria bacterium]
MAKLSIDIKWATRQRLEFIEIMAYYTGSISRSGLARTFGISDPAATKDLKLYNDLAPGNLVYDPGVFGFIPEANFTEMFADLSPATVLPMIANNLISVKNPSEDKQVYGIATDKLPLPSRLPAQSVLAQIIRAIKAHRQLRVNYHSLSDRQSGSSRIIEPHAIVNNGLRWHIRAYSHDTYDFRDFVLSRVVEGELLPTKAESSPNYDDDWMEIISIQLRPHPGLTVKQRLALSYDYDMVGDLIEIQVRRAMVGYLLQQMSVDTTTDHSLNPNAYQLIVVNRDEIEPFAGWAFL